MPYRFIGETEVSLSEVVQSGTSIVETPLKDKSGNFIPVSNLSLYCMQYAHASTSLSLTTTTKSCMGDGQELVGHVRLRSIVAEV